MTDDTSPRTPDEDRSPSGDTGDVTPGGEPTPRGADHDDPAPAAGTEQGGGVATQAPPAPRPTTPPFTRSSSDRVLGGVAGAVAARLEVDPTLVRVVFVVLAIISGGVAVPAYLLAWAVVARDDDPSPRMYEYVAIREGGLLMWAIAVLLAVWLVNGILDPFNVFNGAPLFPLLLIGIGVALWTRGDRGPRNPSWPRTGAGGPPASSAVPPPPPGSTDPWAASTTDPSSTTGSTTVPLDTSTDPTTPVTPPQQGGGWPPSGTTPVATPPAPGRPTPPRERSILGAVTIAFALIAAGVAAALDATTTVDLGATGVASVALLTIGLGLLVGSVWGRARWLLLVGLLMMPFIGLGVLVREAEDRLGVDVDISSGVGERRVDLAGDDRLPDELKLLAGSIDVDLESWRPTGAELADLDGEGYDLTIELGAGEVDLAMPTDVAWRVTSELGLGEYRVRGDDVRITDTVEETFPFGDDEEFGTEFVREGGPEDGPVLDVLVDVGVGQITIRETTPTNAVTGDDTEELS